MAIMYINKDVLAALRTLKSHPRDTDGMLVQALYEEKTGKKVLFSVPEPKEHI